MDWHLVASHFTVKSTDIFYSVQGPRNRPQILGVSNFCVLGHPDHKTRFDTSGQGFKKTLFAINAIFTHKTRFNTSGQGFKKTLFAINAIFSKDSIDSE